MRVIAQANITAQMRRYQIPSYEAFLQRSVEDPDWFWKAFLDDIGFHWHTPYERTVDLSEGKPFAKWFVGGKHRTGLITRWSAMCRRARRGDCPALGGRGRRQSAPYTLRPALRGERARARIAGAGCSAGRPRGAVSALHPRNGDCACWRSRESARLRSRCFQGLVAEPIISRMQDAEAECSLLPTGFPRRGKIVPMKETALTALESLPQVKRVIVVEARPA